MMEFAAKQRPAANAVDAYVEVFFRCKETVNPDGSGSMVDTVRGATYKPSVDVGATLVNGDTTANSLVPTITNSVALTAGSWPNFRKRSVVLFAFGQIVDKKQLRIPIGQGDGDKGFGSSTGGLISLSCGGGAHILITHATGNIAYLAQNGIQSFSLWDLPPNGTYAGVVLEFEPLSQADPRMLGKLIDTSGAVFDFGTPSYTDENGTYTYVPCVIDAPGAGFQTADAECNPGLNNKTRFEGLALMGFAAFSFPGSLPSRAILDAAYVEMMDDWLAGRRIPPSQFRYLNQIP